MYYKQAFVWGISVLAIATVATRDVASNGSTRTAPKPGPSVHEVQAALSNERLVQVADAGNAMSDSESWRQWPSLTDF